MTLADILPKIEREFNHLNIIIEDNLLIAEEYYESDGTEKNDDDCCDQAQENGDEIVEMFPELEVVNYYCHRHKYSIVELKIKENTQ